MVLRAVDASFSKKTMCGLSSLSLAYQNDVMKKEESRAVPGSTIAMIIPDLSSSPSGGYCSRRGGKTPGKPVFSRQGRCAGRSRSS